MLTRIKLKNFRAFREEIDVRIRPITILIGRNSAGKSTLIKFLLMLQQTLESGESSFFVTEGRHVSLGTFQYLRNTKSSSNKLEFQLDLKTTDLPDPLVQQVRNDLQRSQKIRIIDNETIELSLQLKTSIPVPSKYPSVGKFCIDGEIPYKSSTKAKHTVYGKILDLNLETLLFRSRLKSIPIIICWFIVLNRNLVPIFSSNNIRLTKFLRFSLTDRPAQDIFQFTLDNFYLDSLRQEMTSIRHLSPIREESERSVILGSPPPDDVGHRGEYAMPHLQRILDEGGERADFVLKHIESVVDIEDVKFKPQVKGFIPEFRAKNKLTGAEAYLADFGFGVSQCIPIFVQGALLNKGQLLIVEQPESQIHPTAQLEMGSFFAELWTERGVPSIVETHSENIILRLRNLIARKKLNSQDVTIAYFDIKDNYVRVKNLDVNSDGSFEKGLPMEFFGADIIEALYIDLVDEK
jgi:predicted ATPase